VLGYALTEKLWDWKVLTTVSLGIKGFLEIEIVLVAQPPIGPLLPRDLQFLPQSNAKAATIHFRHESCQDNQDIESFGILYSTNRVRAFVQHKIPKDSFHLIIKTEPSISPGEKMCIAW
jgi:hypothetical protein